MGNQCQYEFQSCWENKRRFLYPSLPSLYLPHRGDGCAPQGGLPPTSFPLSLKWRTNPPYQAPLGKKSPFQTLLSA